MRLGVVICTVMLSVATGACAPDPDDAGKSGAPPQPVSYIDSHDGPLWLGAPPTTFQIPEKTLDDVSRGLVAVRATGCGPVSFGTAFAVAPGLLVVSAHVINGASIIEIEAGHESSSTKAVYLADVVGYSQARDLALLRTDASVQPLHLGRAQLGAVAAVPGYPDGSKLEVSPARVEHYVSASGLWGEQVRRRVYVLAANVRSGQSGSPLVDIRGNVIGVAFATIRGPSNIAFALSRDELLSFLATVGVHVRNDYLGRTLVSAQPSLLNEVPNGECQNR